jgi:hypothetical protein
MLEDQIKNEDPASMRALRSTDKKDGFIKLVLRP